MKSEDDAVWDTFQLSGGNVPLRTYSRHGRTIRHRPTTLPEHLPLASDLTRPDSHGDLQRTVQGDRQGRNQRGTTAPLTKTVTEVFWELLSSSAPAFTHPPEADHLGLCISVEAEEDTAPIDKQPHSQGPGDELPAQNDNFGLEMSPGQRAYDPSHELTNLTNTRQHDLSHPRFFSGETLTNSLTRHSKQDRLLCNDFSPHTPKTKRARRSLDVDESLSVIEATSASVMPPSRNPIARWKDNDFQVFRRPDIGNETRFTHSSDGFDSDESRPSVVAKRRRIDGIDRGMGSLELTQKSIAPQKIEGPTWIRGQKKSRVVTTTSPWSRRKYFSNTLSYIESEEDNEPLQAKQSKPTGRGTRNRSQRRISNIMSDDDEKLVGLHALDVLMHEPNTLSNAGVEVGRKTRAKRVKDFPYISDAEEPVMLLVHPADNDDEAPVATVSSTKTHGFGANIEEEALHISDGDESVVLLGDLGEDEEEAAFVTIPRTDTPENAADIDKAVGELPPKQWVLNMLGYAEDTLALRPDSREWMREVEVPDKSPRE